MNATAGTTPIAYRALSTRHLLMIIMALAVILRLLSALYQGDQVQILPGTHDQLSYDALARRLLAGHGFSFADNSWPLTRAGEPTAHWSYLYTLYLSTVYALFGTHPLVARLIQAVAVGILHCWLVWRLGRRLFGPRIAMTAVALSAVYAYFVYYSGALMTEPFYIVAILWTLDASLRLADALAGTRPSWLRWLELGLAIGVTVLLRQAFILFVPFLFVWVLWRVLMAERGNVSVVRRLGTGLLGLAGVTAVVVLMILPWTLRNYRAFDTFVPLNTNSGYAFFWGNHPIYGTSFIGILPANGPSYQDLIPQELRHLNEAELDSALLERGIGFVVADPVRYVKLSVSRTREYFKFWPSPASSTTSNIARVGSFGLLLPFMLYGILVTVAKTWRQSDRNSRAGILLLALFAIVYSGIHLMTWALIRYRLPVDAILLFFAAIALVDIAARLSPATVDSPNR